MLNNSRKIVSPALSLEEARRQLEKLEARLCVSEERFRFLVESSSDWIWETDANFVCTYSNPKIWDMLGYTPEEVLGHTLLDFILIKNHFLPEFHTARETGQPFHQVKLSCLHKNGQSSILEISGDPILARDGALRGWRGITRNAVAAQQQQLLEDIINQNDAVVIVWRIELNQWRVEFISQNIINILGYTPDDFLSGRVLWSDITHQEDNLRLEKEAAQHFKQGDKKWSQEYRMITKTGETRWFHDNNLTITGLTDGITKVQAIIYDITERKKIEKERKLISNLIIQAREEEKRRFSTAFHDAIGSMVVGLSSSLLIAEEEIRHGSANTARAKLEQTRELLKEITVMMKQVCIDIMPPALEISGLDGPLSELVSQFGNRTKIKTSCSINLPNAVKKAGNPIKIVIYRLVQEALNNAAKYSKAENLEIIVNHDDDKVTLVVRDDGCGFNTDKTQFKTNLGLRIMQEETESVGGNLLIDSKPGSGTVIKAVFPPPPPGGDTRNHPGAREG